MANGVSAVLPCNYFFEASIAQAITAAANISSIIAKMTSDIPSLEKKALHFDSQIASWNKWYVWSLALALIAGLVSFMAQRQTIVTGRRLAGVRGEIATAKEELLQRDLKEKDLQIGTLNQGAAEAKRKQAEAEEAMMRMRLPRWITDESLVILRNAPVKAPIAILYLDGNQEAYLLAQHFRISFEMTGWPVLEEKPASVTRTPNLGVRLEVGTALYKEQKEGLPLQLEEPAKSLWEFFQANLQSATTGGFKVNKELPPTTAVIVIGSKTM